jgi:hypothetical protein
LGLDIKVQDLKNKTTIMDFYRSKNLASGDAIAEIEGTLADNHVRLGSEQLSRLRDEYVKAASAIAPLLDRISRTDLLIDLVVYNLYGLTPDDIAIVEKCDINEVMRRYGFAK